MQQLKWWKIVFPGAIVIMVVIFVSLMNVSFQNEKIVYQESDHFYKSVPIPDSVTFAGQSFPVSRFDIREALDRELLVNSYFHSQTIRFIKLAPRYFSVIEPILEEKGIPDDIKYLAVAESNLNPKAVSPAGAVGFWQFMKVTGIEYGLEINSEVDERYHVEKATRAASDYLLKSFRTFKNWFVVAAAYNSGNGFIQTQIARQKSGSYFDLTFGEETERYVFRVIALKLVLEHPEHYGFRVDESEKYPLIETRDVEVNGSVANLADFAAGQGISYKMLKYFNPWLRDNKLTNAHKKKYLIRIPKDINSFKPVE